MDSIIFCKYVFDDNNIREKIRARTVRRACERRRVVARARTVKRKEKNNREKKRKSPESFKAFEREPYVTRVVSPPEPCWIRGAGFCWVSHFMFSM